MRVDWVRVLGCAGSILACLGIWAALGILALSWYLHR